MDVGCRQFFLFDKKYAWDILLSISENSFEERKGTHTDKTSCCVVNHIITTSNVFAHFHMIFFSSLKHLNTWKSRLSRGTGSSLNLMGNTYIGVGGNNMLSQLRWTWTWNQSCEKQNSIIWQTFLNFFFRETKRYQN